jgi:hypothetical protein
MLGKHLDHPAVLTQVIVARHSLGHPLSIGDIEDAGQAIRDHFVGSEQEKVAWIGSDDVAHPGAEDPCCFGLGCARPLDVDGIVAEVGKLEVHDQHTPIGDGIVAHTVFPFWRELHEFFDRTPVVLE